jgi:purine-binding chemotaxis protein CheW
MPDTAPATRTHLVTDGSNRYLTFRLGAEVMALDILDVTEIIEFRPLTEVPMMPPSIRGVLNLRGRVVPVVDLAVRFARGSTEVARRTAIVIVEPQGRGESTAPVFGIVVDAVNEVTHFGDGDIEPPPTFGAGVRCDFISGMAKRDTDFIIVLDVERVMTAEDLQFAGEAARVDPTAVVDPETAGIEPETDAVDPEQ